MPRLASIIVLCLCSALVCAQSKLVLPTNSKARIKFEWNSNLIIIPVSIQGVELRFLVDTGVGHTLIFDNHKAKQLGFSEKRPYLLRGLGDQPALEAYQVEINQLDIGSFYIENITALVLPESEFVLSKHLGTHIDGIIGHDLFESYPVLIDYPRKPLEINPVKTYRRWVKRNTTTLDLDFYKRKPYVDLTIPQLNHKVKGGFLIDTGLSDALWLFSKDVTFRKTVPVFDDYLGTGINGDVHGQRGKIPSLIFGTIQLNEIKIAYPDSTAFASLKFKKNRLGSVGAELLSRFKLLFDYSKKQLLLKASGKTKQPFYYNLSGIELAYEGVQMVKQRLPSVQRKGATGNSGIEVLLNDRYQLSFHPALTVTYVRLNSPAFHVGIQEGDILMQINGREIHKMSLEKVLTILQKEPGEKIKLTVKRENQLLKFTVRLQSFFSLLS